MVWGYWGVGLHVLRFSCGAATTDIRLLLLLAYVERPGRDSAVGGMTVDHQAFGTDGFTIRNAFLEAAVDPKSGMLAAMSALGIFYFFFGLCGFVARGRPVLITDGRTRPLSWRQSPMYVSTPHLLISPLSSKHLLCQAMRR